MFLNHLFTIIYLLSPTEQLYQFSNFLVLLPTHPSPSPSALFLPFGWNDSTEWLQLDTDLVERVETLVMCSMAEMCCVLCLHFLYSVWPSTPPSPNLQSIMAQLFSCFVYYFSLSIPDSSVWVQTDQVFHLLLLIPRDILRRRWELLAALLTWIGCLPPELAKAITDLSKRWGSKAVWGFFLHLHAVTENSLFSSWVNSCTIF